MDGILIVDKPKGATSHDIVDFVRKRFSVQKVGHAGTLDPEATGVLVLLVGKWTKRSQEFTNSDKEYQACLTLGIATDTWDAHGRIIKKEKLKSITTQKIEQAFSQFLGEIEQVPPMFSAIRHQGKRLYSLARQGIELQRSKRQVHIYKLQITEINFPDINFLVSCSKGTYIRSLCVDIARALGCLGYLSALRRVSCGRFTLAQALSLENLKNFSDPELEQALLR
ncbi:MAG: tRNA pseudouridine(55) synthase TruB [Candidatus Omnitrophica bacterium]|nr:tRNA pseudouridine(55) synthase TruB [Candidatus Omnitrophota bacterium]